MGIVLKDKSNSKLQGFQNKIIMRKLIKINGKISKLQNTIGKGGNLKKKMKCKNEFKKKIYCKKPVL